MMGMELGFDWIGVHLPVQTLNPKPFRSCKWVSQKTARAVWASGSTSLNPQP